MGQQKIQNMFIRAEGGCFHLTPGGWVGLLNTPRNTHTQLNRTHLPSQLLSRSLHNLLAELRTLDSTISFSFQ